MTKKKVMKADGMVQLVLPVQWRIDDWSGLWHERLVAEALSRSQTEFRRSGADAMSAEEIRMLLGSLVTVEDVVLSAAVESVRLFDEIAMDDHGIDLGLRFDEIHILDDGGSIEIRTLLSVSAARRMINGRFRQALRESGTPNIFEVPVPEPTASQYSDVLSSDYLPNAGEALASIPKRLMVDRIVDAALEEYEKAVALRDPTRRVAAYGPIHNPAWHAVPSPRRH